MAVVRLVHGVRKVYGDDMHWWERVYEAGVVWVWGRYAVLVGRSRKKSNPCRFKVRKKLMLEYVCEFEDIFLMLFCRLCIQGRGGGMSIINLP